MNSTTHLNCLILFKSNAFIWVINIIENNHKIARIKLFQDIQNLDSFGHTITTDEGDLNTFDVPFVTNDHVDDSFLVSDNQVCLDIIYYVLIGT